MKILVTGGCGFVGANLIGLLVPQGHVVRVLDDESMGRRSDIDAFDVEFLKGSITDAEMVASAVEGVDAVVHLAADTRVIDSIANPVKNFQSNVVGSFNLLQAMREASVERIVAASTGGAILGEVPCPVHEEIVPRPLSPYGASKLAMEGYLSAFGGAYGFKWASLRFANVYGPYSLRKESVVALYFRKIMNGEDLTVYGNGEQIRDYVYSTDLAEGVVSALAAEAVGVFQLGTGIPTSLNQLISEMRETVGPLGDFKVSYVDKRAGEIVNTYCDISKARAAFGYNAPTSLREGLHKTWSWLNEARSAQNA